MSSGIVNVEAVPSTACLTLLARTPSLIDRMRSARVVLLWTVTSTLLSASPKIGRIRERSQHHHLPGVLSWL